MQNAVKNLQNAVSFAVILTEVSHVFCCVLPTIFSVLSVLAGIGLMSTLPVWMIDFHEVLHHWELPIILASGGMVMAGWGLYGLSQKMDCHDNGCGHGPCGTRKNRAGRVLRIATILFIVNVTIYGVVHRGMGIFLPELAVSHDAHHHAE